VGYGLGGNNWGFGYPGSIFPSFTAFQAAIVAAQAREREQFLNTLHVDDFHRDKVDHTQIDAVTKKDKQREVANTNQKQSNVVVGPGF
jgi:hypothetical protein